MPAVPSSPIGAALGRLECLSAGERARLSGDRAGLAACLVRVPDPRKRRGTRHGLASLLLAAVAAVLAGARSFTAIAEWVADAPPGVLSALGIRCHPLTGVFSPPDETTIRRVLERVDAAALDAVIGSWLVGQLPRGQGRRALAVDGKSLRGTRHSSAGGQAAHLLAVADQRASAVLAQAAVDGKTNEITCFAPLLEPLDLTGAVVTADAMHAQREHAKFLVETKKAHYILMVKNNQPTLRRQLARLPWRQVPPGHTETSRGHGREEHRALKVTSVAAGLSFPHAAQAIQVKRRRRKLGTAQWSTETAYGVTSLPAHQASPADLAGWVRGHWHIEALHHIRDVTYREDHSQIRTGSGPQVMATLRNAAIGILKTTGHTSIAAACRYHARDATRPLTTLGLSPP